VTGVTPDLVASITGGSYTLPARKRSL